MANLLTISRLEKRFGDRRLLDVAELNFESGVLHLLVGDNGVGKTTLLKCLAGLEKSDAIALALNGHTYGGGTYPASLRREIVYVHQHPYLFSTSIDANIAYGLNIREIAVLEQEKAVQEAIHWAGLEGVRKVSPKRLSGGEKQRVALARAMVLKPVVMLIDEPTANLDATARDQVKALLASMRAEGQIVLIATHDPAMLALPGVAVWDLAAGKLARRIEARAI